jgi:hypothetical protein
MLRDQLPAQSPDSEASMSETSPRVPAESLSLDDVRVLCQSLNEVLNGIDVFEFETRLGASRDEVNELLDKLEGIHREMAQVARR